MCDDCAQSVENVLDPLPHPMVVDIQSGDVLVVHTAKRSPDAVADRIKSQLATVSPGAKVLVIDDGCELTHVLRPAQGPS